MYWQGNPYHRKRRHKSRIRPSGTFHARKAERTEYFEKFVKGWKLVTCGSCNGSGYYDNTDKHGRIPFCGSCEGTGKNRVSPEEYKQYYEANELAKKALKRAQRIGAKHA